MHGVERIKNSDGRGYFHANQKPLPLMRCMIEASTLPGDVVWEPFGGLMSASVAADQCGRKAYVAEINDEFFQAGHMRVQSTNREFSM